MARYHWMVCLVLTLSASGSYAQVAPDAVEGDVDSAPVVEPPRFEGAPETAPMAKPTPPPEKKVTIVLVDGSRLIGELVDSPKIDFQTEFGDLSIPLEKIKGARLKTSEDTAPHNEPFLLFTNGDSISAEPMFESLKLKTIFGESTIERKHISSIVRSRQAFGWSYDGSRWWLTFASDYNTPAGEYRPIDDYPPPVAPTRAVAPALFAPEDPPR